LELSDDLGHTVAAMQLTPRLHMLPPEQEAHEVGSRHRLDFLTQPAQRQAMNAREQPSFAPLFSLRLRSETTPQHRPHTL
jgi:hypothetical protein